jgi:hypothetical protein
VSSVPPSRAVGLFFLFSKRDADGQLLEPVKTVSRQGVEDVKELGSLPETKLVASVEHLGALVEYLLTRAQKVDGGTVAFVDV